MEQTSRNEKVRGSRTTSRLFLARNNLNLANFGSELGWEIKNLKKSLPLFKHFKKNFWPDIRLDTKYFKSEIKNFLDMGSISEVYVHFSS